MADQNIQMHNYKNGYNREFPITKTKLVFDDTGKPIDTILEDFMLDVGTQLDSTINSVNELMDENPLTLGKKYGVTKGSDVTVALQMLVDKAVLESRAIRIPEGDYYVSSTINIPASALEIEGNSMMTTRLIFLGEGPLFNIGSGGIFRIRKISLFGNNVGTDTIRNSNVFCFLSEMPIQATEIYVKSFHQIVMSNGGYYYKFINCRFFNFYLGFQINANNVIFDSCRAANFNTFMLVRGGTGPISATNCSFERFTSRGFTATSGAKPLLNMSGCYIENYPRITPPTELGPAYDDAYFIAGFYSITLTGNQIAGSGIRRFIYSGGNMGHLISTGNFITYQGPQGDLEYFIFVGGTILRMFTMDTATNNLTGLSNKYDVAYLSPSQKVANSGNGSIINDPITQTVYNPL